jgi:hypothetical protein
LLDQALNVTQHLMFIDAYQRNSHAIRASAASTADAVNVIFWHVW